MSVLNPSQFVRGAFAASLGILLFAAAPRAQENDHWLRLATARMLVGYGPTDLAITTPADAVRVQPVEGEPEAWSHVTLVSLSRDGMTVATARLHGPGREAIATYSVADKTWREYASVYHLWSISISPDGAKLAFISEEAGARPVLKLLDRASGSVQTLVPAQVSELAAPSWSPDSQRMAYQAELPWRNELRGRREFEIRVVEVRGGAVTKVVPGQNPAWSPSGEWIAYLDLTGEPQGGGRCMAVRPDGTNVTALCSVAHKNAPFVWAPVWSPDSSQLLLNEIDHWEGWRVYVDLLDFSTHILTRKLHSHGEAVLGWARYER